MSDDRFAALRDPNPPTPDAATLASVRRRARGIRRRRRSLWAATSAVGAVIVGVVAMAIVDDPDDNVSTAVTPAPTTTTAAADAADGSAMSPGEAAAVCYREPFASTEMSATDRVPIDGWPDDAPALLMLGGNGELWVIDDGDAVRWTTASSEEPGVPGYLWARWAGDGSILTTRLIDAPHVVIERLTAPGEATVAAELPYSVNPDAPEGYCPIDGYTTRFAAMPGGLVLTQHISGPVPHSCPPLPDTTATADPGRCASPEAVSFEVRAGDVADSGTSLNTSIGSRAEPVADAARANVFAVTNGDGQGATLLGLDPGTCCWARESGTAFSLSPDGTRIAYSPDGHQLVVADVAATADPPPIWSTGDGIRATAFTDTWIAVATSGALFLMAPDGRGVIQSFLGAAPAVVTLDWAA